MKDSAYYKERLEKEKKVLLGELKGVGVIAGPKKADDWEAVADNVDIQTPDSNEVADKIESYEENTALVSELEGRLMDIDAALEKIEKGTYGLCEVDNAPIEEDRLEANPAARTCKQHIEK